jgi:hypothetical protein
MITRNFATYNFVCKRWNDACYNSVIPNLRLWIPIFLRPSQIPSWLRRVAIPPAGQIRHIHCLDETWYLLEDHLMNLFSSSFCFAMPQITDFATAFSRLESIKFLMVSQNDLSETYLGNAIAQRTFRLPLLNFWKPRLPASETLDIASRTAAQRWTAGFDTSECAFCSLSASNLCTNKQDFCWDSELMQGEFPPSVNTRKHRVRKGHREITMSCPRDIGILPYKMLSLSFKDAEINIFVWPDSATMSIKANDLAVDQQSRRTNNSVILPLPDTSKGSDYVQDYIERMILLYLYEVSMVPALPDLVIEKEPLLPQNDYRSWWFDTYQPATGKFGKEGMDAAITVWQDEYLPWWEDSQPNVKKDRELVEVDPIVNPDHIPSLQTMEDHESWVSLMVTD